MNYLLDTHVFLWALIKTEELSRKAKKIIENPGNEIYISAISFWEISIKTRLKKLDLGPLRPDDLLQYAEKMEFQAISLTPEEAMTYYKLNENSHSDPFDRMLVWQAISRNMALISKDNEFAKFIPYGLTLVW